VLLSIQVGVLITGAVLSFLAVRHRTGAVPASGGRIASRATAIGGFFFVAAISAALLLMTVTSFHLRIPLGLLLRQ
jgi:hypothetical protein